MLQENKGNFIKKLRRGLLTARILRRNITVLENPLEGTLECGTLFEQEYLLLSYVINNPVIKVTLTKKVYRHCTNTSIIKHLRSKDH